MFVYYYCLVLDELFGSPTSNDDDDLFSDNLPAVIQKDPPVVAKKPVKTRLADEETVNVKPSRIQVSFIVINTTFILNIFILGNKPINLSSKYFAKFVVAKLN